MSFGLAPKRDIVEICFPNNDNGVATTPGNSWTYSAWAQLTASLATDLILTGVYVYKLISATATPIVEKVQLSIGTGGAGSETTIAVVTTAIGYTSSAAVETKSIIIGEFLPIMPTRIDSGTRVAIRSTKSGTGAFGLNVKIVGYPANSFPPILQPPTPEQWLSTMEKAGGSTVQPSAGVVTLQTGGTLWTYGAWTQIVASAAADLIITGITAGDVVVSGGFDMEIGTGAASSEVSHGLLCVVGRTFFPGPGNGYWALSRPIFVKAGERIAGRIRGRPVSQNYDIILQTQELNN